MSRKRRNDERKRAGGTRKAGSVAPAPPADAANPPQPDRGSRRALWLVIPLTWLLILGLLEGGLRLAGVGAPTSLFVAVEPGMLVDNTDYTRRFYSVYDRPELVQKTNLFGAEKRPGRLRVFVVGESTAQGYPYERNHSFSAIAQAGLRAAGVDVEVLNVGNSAMTSYYVREVLRELPRYQPDFVAVYAGHNEYYGTPSMFTGGTHATRLAILRLKRFRTVQAIQAGLARLLTRGTPSQTLMERRFAEGLFPPDSVRDREAGALFLRNLEAGLSPLEKGGVPTAIFEPVSNLVDMPPFRVAAPAPREAEGAADSRGAAAVEDRAPGPAGEYQSLRASFGAGEWNRAAWVAIKDQDAAPFRARSALTDRLRAFVAADPALTWIGTADELEATAGREAFSDRLFIDHLHFNFDGQLLLGRMLARAVLQRFYPGDAARLETLDAYMSDPERVRADIHLTAFWEFEAYTRVANLQNQEPFASMPVQKAAPPVPERVMRNSLFTSRDFVDSIRRGEADDLFFAALDFYHATGNLDEFIRNMNAYVHVYPGHYESHLAYATALFENDPRANIDMAGSYIRTAYLLSGRDPQVATAARQSLVNSGLGALWPSFEANYLRAD